MARRDWPSLEFTLLLSDADKAGRVPHRSDSWRFFTNHGHVLACLVGDPDARLRDIADRVGITERAAHDLVRDLERGGYIRVRRVGRRNQYEVCGVRSSGGLAGPGGLGRLVGLLVAELDGSLETGSRAGTGAMTPARPAAGGHPADEVLDPPLWARSLDGELRERVAGATVEIGSLPVLDGTVQRMLALLDDPDSSSSAAVAAIEQDADFAAQLLRLANSAYYGRRSNWRTVRQAFAAIGRAATRRLCLECATYRFLQRAPGNGSASRGQLHLHALTVATFADEIARRTAVPVETAHLAGLLHDFGKLVMPLAFGEERLDELACAYPAGGVARAIAEWEHFGIDHAHAGALYAQQLRRRCGAVRCDRLPPRRPQRRPRPLRPWPPASRSPKRSPACSPARRQTGH